MTAPFEIKMTEKEAFDGLKSNYGTEFTAADVRAFCAMNDIGYSTVTGKIKQYKVGKGIIHLLTKSSVLGSDYLMKFDQIEGELI